MKHVWIIALIFFISLATGAFASGSISVSSVSVPTSVTQGDTFTITMSVSGSEANTVKGSLTLPSGLSCTPTGTQDISLSTSGTGSASWTCSATMSGDYSNKITASVTAKDSSTAATLSDSEQTGLSVLSPAALSASSSILATSITTTGSTTLTVGLNNAGDTATTYTITMTCTGLTCSPSSATGSISGNSLVNTQITVSGTTAGTYTPTASITGGNGQTLSTSKSLTVTATNTGTNPGSGTPTNTTNVTTPTATTTKIRIPALQQGVPYTIDSATLLKTSETNIRKMIITSNALVGNVEIQITKEAGKPASVSTPSGTVFSYLSLTHANVTDSDISSVQFEFQIPLSWITQNNINRSTILMNRYSNGSWSALTTTFKQEDSSVVVYDVSSPGLSVFAITAQPNEVTVPVPQGNETGPTTPSFSLDTTMLVILIIIIVVAVGVFLWFQRPKKSDTSFSKKQKYSYSFFDEKKSRR
ncbi:MAG: PGF-pre-PGF domain-containing protein [Candidatus Aenigmarchaeota archaeon]|nr:PGF-pre-PGF domain-containing protein [Candidatus Aenigmarchaeota archaeon]